MGIILGVEAAVGIAEAVGAAAEGSEVIASAAEAGEAISAAADAGGEAGAAAATDAAGAVESGGEALASALETLSNALVKVNKMVEEFIVIDTVFKAAKKILEALLEDPTALVRARKLDKLVKVLNQAASLLKELVGWLQLHSPDTTNIQGMVVTLQGVLSKFIPKLGAAGQTLKNLSSQISKKNLKKEPVTNGEVEAIERGLQTVLESLKSLADFKAEHQAKVPQLSGLPIDQSKLASLQTEMP